MASIRRPTLQPFAQVRGTKDPAISQLNDNIVNTIRGIEQQFTNIDNTLLQTAEFALATSSSLGGLSGSYAEVSTSVAPLTSVPILSGSLVGPQALSGTPVAISHSLGRVPTGFFVADITTGSVIYRTAWDASTITVVNDPTHSVNVKLWVF